MSERRHSRGDNVSAALPAVRSRGDTIVAVATATGRSAVSIVRLSGAGAEQIARRCVSPWPARPRELLRCVVHAPDDPAHAIDDGLVAVFVAPRSYTGETVVEIHGHGGMYLPGAIQAALVSAGARPALPGEFTERAVLSGKLDLLRAEAIGELIDARTRASHRAAMHALSGTLMSQYDALRTGVIEIEALITYDIDFPDEDHGPVDPERVDEAVMSLGARIEELLETKPGAILARDGAVVVLAGPPNAGKSSLFNALIGESRVIVSDKPGTTRDAVEVLLDTDPWPIRLVDTAGLRDHAESVERLGIEVSERYLRGADAVVACSETHGGLAAVVTQIRALSDAPVIAVQTKADLRLDTPHGAENTSTMVSVVNGRGLSRLQARIANVVATRAGHPGEPPTGVTNARQRAALEAARDELGLFRLAWRKEVLPRPVAATHLRAAVNALDHLLGAIDVEDVFSRVFATFCVGK